MMLGRTAGGLFWMFRYLERSENVARLMEAGLRIALTRNTDANEEWTSVLSAAGARTGYLQRHEVFEAPRIVDYLLRDRANPSSVLSAIEAARSNARMVRTALTREVFEATNESYLLMRAALERPVSERRLPEVLALIRQQGAQVAGAHQGTVLRNDGYDFARLGTFIERADNTARILDVKYYVLLPSVSLVGSSLDNVQWETILRAVSAYRSFRWLNEAAVGPRGIASFLMLDRRMPRSLAFCAAELVHNLGMISEGYGAPSTSLDHARALLARLHDTDIDAIFAAGLHEFLSEHLRLNAALACQIEAEFQFIG